MTVSYNTKVTDAGLMTFIRLFFRWKGSVWKAVYKELIFWLFIYFLLNLAYRFLMTSSQKEVFENICIFFRSYTNFIPLTFMLGFFVNLVVNRWWSMWENIGWIDTPCLYVNAYIGGNDDRSRMYRRNIIRYLLFFQVNVFRDISTSIRKRFPTLETFIVSGYLTELELLDYQSTPTTYKNYYTPIRWAMNLVRQARAENRINNDIAVGELNKIIITFRHKMGTLLDYDFQPIPLIYTVVVCLSVRLYFVAALLGQQIVLDKNEIDTFVPIMTIVQFVFYMGWMKVAEALLNPFGDDDDDFECNWLLDRNFEVGFVIADQNYDRALVRDKHWNTKYPEPLYSLNSMKTEIHPLIGSAVRKASVQATHRNSITLNSVNDVIMFARAPVNENEDAISLAPSDAKVHVRRTSRISFDNSGLSGVGSLLNGARQKLSRLTSKNVKLPDSESGNEDVISSGGKDNENFVFSRSLPNVIRQNDGTEFHRRYAPSMIREEDDHDGQYNHAIDLADEFNLKQNINGTTLNKNIDKNEDLQNEEKNQKQK